MARFRSVNALRSYVSAHGWEQESPERPEEDAQTGPFVTVSRQVGAGGTTVAELLAEILNERARGGEGTWTVFDKNLGLRVLDDHDLPHSYVEFLKEESVPGLRTAMEEFFEDQIRAGIRGGPVDAPGGWFYSLA